MKKAAIILSVALVALVWLQPLAAQSRPTQPPATSRFRPPMPSTSRFRPPPPPTAPSATAPAAGRRAPAATAATAASAPAPSVSEDVKVIGLSVAKADPSLPTGAATASGLPGGVWLHLAVAVEGKNVFGLDVDGLKVAAFTDDTGTDLIKADAAGNISLAYGAAPDDRGKGIILHIGARQPAAPAAKAVKLSGRLLLVAGSDEKTADLPQQSLAKGAKVEFGGMSLTVANVRPNGTGRIFTFTSDSDLTTVKSISFVADGKTLSSQRVGVTKTRLGSSSVYVLDVLTDLPGSEAGIKAAWYEKVERLTVPLNLTVGVGL